MFSINLTTRIGRSPTQSCVMLIRCMLAFLIWISWVSVARGGDWNGEDVGTTGIRDTLASGLRSRVDHAAGPADIANCFQSIPLNGYKVQMHLHGHSNHNGSGKQASMQWHEAQAKLTDSADILWWSDHTGLFDARILSGALDVDFSQGVIARDTFELRGLAAGIGQVTRLRPNISPSGRHWAIKKSAGLEFGIESSGNPSWETFEYLLESDANDGKVKGFRLARPISSGARLEWRMDATGLAADVEVEIELRLAWHFDFSVHEGHQHRLILRLDPSVGEVLSSPNGAESVLVRIPVSASRKYSLGLKPFASEIQSGHGDDNTISQIYLRVRARNGASGSVRIDELSVSSDDPEPMHQLEQIQMFGAVYEKEFLKTNHVGLEFGAELPHFNGFFPEPLIDDALLKAPPSISKESWISGVHERRGLVSLNHPFGATSRTLVSEEEQEKMLAATSAELIANKAFGADILEVGYLARGGASLATHLRLWDLLAANGVFLLGNGTSDSHGGDWHVDMAPGSFTTWVYAESPEPDDLIDALKRGHAVFGNPWLWDGRFHFWVGAYAMGARTVPIAEAQPLKVLLDPWPNEIEVYLVQGLIRQARSSVKYLHNGTRILPLGEFFVDVSEPCFVRLEVYERVPDGSVRPVVFSNPIVFSADNQN